MNEDSQEHDPLTAAALDKALLDARQRTRELTDLELVWHGKEPLSAAEIGLLRYGVGRGWVTCIEYLRDNGILDQKT